MNIAKLINVAEKGHYPFKAWPDSKVETLLFPGCSFPSYFPRTTDAIVELCRGWGMGVAYDCCGKSLKGYGEAQLGARVLSGLTRRLKERSTLRIVTLCPNCLQHLGTNTNTLGCEVISIFDLLAEKNFQSRGQFGSGKLFIPCPDKGSRRLEQLIRAHWDLSAVETLGRVGCCGLRPEIMSRGAQAVAKSTNRVLEACENQTLYSYCSSCAGQFGRAGYGDCRHVLSVLLGIEEAPDVAHGLKNRARRRFDTKLNPQVVFPVDDQVSAQADSLVTPKAPGESA